MAEGLPEKPKRSALNQLTRTLLRKYDCGVRPVHNWTSLTTVYIDLILQSVLDVVRERSHCCNTLTACNIKKINKQINTHRYTAHKEKGKVWNKSLNKMQELFESIVKVLLF